MTSEHRFEQDLPDLLARLAMEPTPSYRDDVVQQTAAMRQRPVWMFPERWIPMTTFMGTTTGARQIPWRAIGLMSLLVLVLVAGAVVLSPRPRPRPAPFGPAANGSVAYSTDGDIFVVDPRSGRSTAIVTGPDDDRDPVWSRDGTQIAFRRESGTGSQVFVVGSDGSGLTLVTSEPVAITDPSAGEYSVPYAFTPDGTELLLVKRCGPTWITKTDGSDLRKLDRVSTDGRFAFRPPNGEQIAFAGCDRRSIGIVNTDGTGRRTLVGPQRTFTFGRVGWSPDGTSLAYVSWYDDPDWRVRVRIVGADGTGDRPLREDPAGDFDFLPEWSNDGTRMVMARGYGTKIYAVVLPVDGTDPGVVSSVPLAESVSCCANLEWAPDDTTILVTPADVLTLPMQQMLLDPETGEMRPTPWKTTSQPTWQRLAQ